MKEKNPIGLLLEQIADLLKRIQTHGKPLSPVSPEALEKLETLERAMEAFKGLTQMALQGTNIDMSQKTNERSEFLDRPTKEMRILERAKTIEREAKYIQQMLLKTIGPPDQQKAEENKGKKKEKSPELKQAKERQKKLKRLGGDGWMRL